MALTKQQFEYTVALFCLFLSLMETLHTTGSEECLSGMYGDDCTKNCSTSCKNDTCNKENGSCTNGCLPGKYADDCTKSCPTYCKNGACHKENGTCTEGCETGHSDSKFCCVNTTFCIHCSPSTCTECVTGRHGEKCELVCSDYCDGACDKSNGSCLECKQNYYGKYCQKYCSSNCIDSQDGSASCSQDNGYCKLGCEPLFYGNTCEDECSSNCNGACDRQSGECSRCKYNYFGQLCENPCPQNCLKLINTTSVCFRENGNCLNGCKEQFYCEQCDKTCPSNCKGSCQLQNGACSSCKTHRFGLYCEYLCSKTCSYSSSGTSSCHQQNGTCQTGCILGYYGAYCENACMDGCKGNSCDRLTGVCSEGCLIGYSGGYCDNVDPDNFIFKAVIVGMCTAAATLILILVLTNICRRLKSKSSGAAQNSYEHIELGRRNQRSTYCDIANLSGTGDDSHIYSNTDRESSHIYCNTTLRCGEQ